MFSFSMKSIFFKLFIITFAVCVSLLIVDAYYRKTYSVAYRFPQKILANQAIPEKYQIVKVGNSHSMDGITFEGYKLRSLSLANAAQKFNIDLAMLKQHSAEIEKNAVILIAVTPISFSHTDVNAQKGLQAEYYGRISPFFIPQLNVGDYIESEFLPFVRSGYFLRQKYADALIEKKVAEEEVGSSSKNADPANSAPQSIASIKTSDSVSPQKLDDYYFQVEAIKKELEHPTTSTEAFENINFTYNKWLHTDEFSKQFFDSNRRDLERLIRYCIKKNWRPVLVTIPISEQMEKALPKEYKQEYLYANMAKTNTQRVEYFDFSIDPQIKANTTLFSNADHLNKKGSAILSYLLLRKLIENNYLEPESDGYNYASLPSK